MHGVLSEALLLTRVYSIEDECMKGSMLVMMIAWTLNESVSMEV